MEFTNEEMVKSLTSLIDETLEEIEEIKKSKFAASEISLGDDKSGVADKSKNGKLEAKKAEDEDEDEDEEEDEDEDMGKADDEDEDEDEESDDMDKADCMDKAEDEDEEHEEKESKKHEKKEPKKEEMKEMKKSLKNSESLMKSYVDERFSSLEKTISKLAAAVEAIADAPVQRKGIPAGVAPLRKSSEETESLSKSEVANKLFELKKTGKHVDSADIFKVETGNNLTVLEIANKYGLR
jgi:cobalamin biosynthesis protein CobT